MCKGSLIVKFWKLVITTTAFVLSTNVNAALIERLGGLAYYDDVANLTWITDANAAYTSRYVGTDPRTRQEGLMRWEDANIWANQLTVAGISGWRLPRTLQPDPSCDIQNGDGLSYGNNCSGSEMGNLFYNVLGNTAGSGSFTNTGPFKNVEREFYWTSSDEATNFAWVFDMRSGYQSDESKYTPLHAWAVQSGDVSAIPVPAAMWLFSSGLIALIGFTRRNS